MFTRMLVPAVLACSLTTPSLADPGLPPAKHLTYPAGSIRCEQVDMEVFLVHYRILVTKAPHARPEQMPPTKMPPGCTWTRQKGKPYLIPIREIRVGQTRFYIVQISEPPDVDPRLIPEDGFLSDRLVRQMFDRYGLVPVHRFHRGEA